VAEKVDHNQHVHDQQRDASCAEAPREFDDLKRQEGHGRADDEPAAPAIATMTREAATTTTRTFRLVAAWTSRPASARLHASVAWCCMLSAIARRSAVTLVVPMTSINAAKRHSAEALTNLYPTISLRPTASWGALGSRAVLAFRGMLKAASIGSRDAESGARESKARRPAPQFSIPAPTIVHLPVFAAAISRCTNGPFRFTAPAIAQGSTVPPSLVCDA
jgi:hypothetical protein